MPIVRPAGHSVTGMIAVFDAMATQGGNAVNGSRRIHGNYPDNVRDDCVAVWAGGTTYLKRKVEYETELFEDQLTLDH